MKKKKKTLKRKPKRKISKPKRKIIQFLKKKKTANDIFHDLVKKTTFPALNKKGEYKLKNKQFLYSLFSVSPQKLNSWIKYGVDEKTIKSKKFKNIIKGLKKDFEIGSYKKITQMYDRTNFNEKDFKRIFSHRRLKVKGSDRLFFKAQIYAKMNNGYIIPEYNFGVYSKTMKSGIDKLNKEVKQILNKWHSLAYWFFNFIDVQKVSIKEL